MLLATWIVKYFQMIYFIQITLGIYYHSWGRIGKGSEDMIRQTIRKIWSFRLDPINFHCYEKACYVKNILHFEHNGIFIIKTTVTDLVGRDGSVGIVTGYGLDGPGIGSRWGARFSAPVQTGPGAHPASCTMGTGSFPGVKSDRDMTLTPHTLLVLWPCKGTAIPLLLLWAVRPVQGLSACTRVTFTFTLPSHITFYDYFKTVVVQIQKYKKQ